MILKDFGEYISRAAFLSCETAPGHYREERLHATRYKCAWYRVWLWTSLPKVPLTAVFPLKSVEKCLLKHMVVGIFFLKGTLMKVSSVYGCYLSEKSAVVSPNCELNLQEWVTIMSLSRIWTGVGVWLCHEKSCLSKQNHSRGWFVALVLLLSQAHMYTCSVQEEACSTVIAVVPAVRTVLPGSSTLLGVFILLSVSLSILSEDSHLYSCHHCCRMPELKAHAHAL